MSPIPAPVYTFHFIVQPRYFMVEILEKLVADWLVQVSAPLQTGFYKVRRALSELGAIFERTL